MLVLSSYRLSAANNGRIADAVGSAGGRFVPTGFDDTLEEIVERIEERIAEATVFLGGRLTHEQFRKGSGLRWIHVPWAGVNALMELNGILESGLLITNSSGVMADSVADQVMAYLVMLNRSLAKQIGWQMRREWNRYTSVEHPDRRILRGMTLGILGYGSIGRAIASRARGFGMRVIALRRSAATAEGDVEAFYTSDRLHELLAGSDFVVVALPLTAGTEGLIGIDEFRRMKPTAYLVNVARGSIVREEDLIAALQGGEIAGAALDVFAEEPLPEDSVLWNMENVIVTPHSSGGFVGFGNAVTDLFIENLTRYVEGRPMLNRVDVERGY